MTRTGETVLTVSSLVALGTSAAAAFITWLLLTQPLTVAGAVSDRDLMPVLRRWPAPPRTCWRRSCGISDTPGEP
jgi:hypothetical protein